MLAGVLLALHNVLRARGAHKAWGTRALVRVPQGFALGPIAAGHGGAVVLQLAVLSRVPWGTGTRIAVQAPQGARAPIEAGVRVARVGHRDLAQGGRVADGADAPEGGAGCR
jgi:hypothetical protein